MCGSSRQPSRKLHCSWWKLVFLMVFVPCVSAAASGPISNSLGVDLSMTNLHVNDTFVASIYAGNTTCSGGRTTSSSAANTTTSSEIKPGESRSLKVTLDSSALNICFRDIASNTYYHASLAFEKDLPLNVKLAQPICDNSLSKMKPGSDCSSLTCSSKDTTSSWSCHLYDHGGREIIHFSVSPIQSQEKVDGLVSGTSRIKDNHFLPYVCALLSFLLGGCWLG